jgi:hypothetical protein
VADETAARGILIAQRERRSAEAEGCFAKTDPWLKEAGIEVHEILNGRPWQMRSALGLGSVG